MTKYFNLPKSTKFIFSLAALCFLVFLGIQLLILFNFLHASYEITVMSLVSFGLYIPLSAKFVYDIYCSYKKEKQLIDDKMAAINSSCIMVIFDETEKYLK